jgi:hypothetical protein
MWHWHFSTRRSLPSIQINQPNRAGKRGLSRIFLGHKHLLHHVFPSKKLMILCPDASMLAIVIGYSSFAVSPLRSLKSMHALILLDPFFFFTNTMLEIHSAYLQGRIKPAFKSRSISALARSWIFGFYFLANYF